jgi:hypothetical protein
VSHNLPAIQVSFFSMSIKSRSSMSGFVILPALSVISGSTGLDGKCQTDRIFNRAGNGV